MAGNLNIKNANGKTLTIQNPDTNSADIVIDGSKIASTVSPVFTGNPVAPTQAAGDNSTKIATTAFCTSQDLGVNQTWEDVTASRSVGTTYTNSTGKPIMVSAYTGWTSSNTILLVVNGVTVQYDGIAQGYTHPKVLGIIPNGATYSILGWLPGKWFELR